MTTGAGMWTRAFLRRAVALLWLLPAAVTAQQIGGFDRIGLEHGLSQSTVYAIVKDRLGFLWFGTQDGLNRFDGYTMTVFKHNAADSNSLSDNVVWSLLSDRDGNVWIGTERGGLNKFVSHEKRFYHFRSKKDDPTTLSDDFVTALFQDTDGNLWVGTQGNGLNLYDAEAGRFIRFLHDRADMTSIAGNAIRAIAEDHRHRLWIATSNGVSRLDLASARTRSARPVFINYRSIPNNRQSLASNNVWTVHVDHAGAVWVGTWGGGLHRYDDSTGTFVRYPQRPNDASSLPSNTIKVVANDPEGRLWIGTYDAGLVRFDHRRQAVRKYLSDFIVSLYRDETGILWIGTFSDGVRVWNRRKNLFQRYMEDKSDSTTIRGNLISAIFEDADGEFWIGTYGEGLNHLDVRRVRIATYRAQPANRYGLSNDRVTAICQSKDGSVWIATNGGGLNRYSKRTKHFQRFVANARSDQAPLFNQISTLCYDAKHNTLFLGYFNGGVSGVDLSTHAWTHYTSTDAAGDPLWGSPITALYQTTQGEIWVANFRGELYVKARGAKRFTTFTPSLEVNKAARRAVYAVLEQGDSLLWFGTYGDGLYRFSRKDSSLRVFNGHSSGVPDVIYGILRDAQGRLWMSTNKGLVRFNPATGEAKTFDVHDGIQSNEFNQGAYFASARGELFFGGVNGFNAFYPEQVEENHYVPPVYLTDFRVFNKPLSLPNPIPPGTTIELSYAQNFFSFSIVALNYTSPEKNWYGYKLEGFDNEWTIVPATQRHGGYTNLDPGRYTLRVKASNNDGRWNDEGTWIAIVITPPFYLTWWFKGAGVLVLLSVVSLVYVRKVSALEKQKRYQQELSSKILEKMEEERKRIAQELHDSIGQELLFIKNKVLLTMQRKHPGRTLREDLTQISETASKVLKSVREISHNLRPPELDRLGLTETLRALLMKVRESTTLTVTGELETIDGLLDRDLEINVVRIVQEAISNVLKHAHATVCRVHIVREGGQVLVRIEDNGRGFKPNLSEMSSEHSGGLGITGMLERVRMLNGTMTIDSEPGKGSVLRIAIPIANGQSEPAR